MELIHKFMRLLRQQSQVSLQWQRRTFICGLITLVSGLIYYMVFRDQLPWPFRTLPFEWARLPGLVDPSMGSYPSFAFTLSMGLIAISLHRLAVARSLVAILAVFAIGLTHEIMASTFAVADVLAGALGAVLAMILLSAVRVSSYVQPIIDERASNKITDCGHEATWLSQLQKRSERFKFIALMLVSASLATGTSAYDPIYNDGCIQFDENGACIEREISASPVYMSYDVLRSSVKMGEPREFESVSRIYLYQNLLFANERNAGIHVVDNTIPTSPVSIAFIEIPGNTELSIRDNYLYADSYIDLVTLDVSNTDNIIEVAREETIFPYNSRQNIPNNVRLVGDINSSFGVVVGYQR